MRKPLQALVLICAAAIGLTGLSGCVSLNFFELGKNRGQIRQEDKYEKTYDFPDSTRTNRYEVAKGDYSK